MYFSFRQDGEMTVKLEGVMSLVDKETSVNKEGMPRTGTLTVHIYILPYLLE